MTLPKLEPKARVEPMYLTEGQVAQMLSRTTRTVRRWVAVGYLPKPIRLGPGSTGRPAWNRKDLLTRLAAIEADQ